jgi:hypothetical protein
MPIGIQFKQYLAKKGAVELYIYRKFSGRPEGKPVLFLVHGSSLAALPSTTLADLSGRRIPKSVFL